MAAPANRVSKQSYCAWPLRVCLASCRTDIRTIGRYILRLIAIGGVLTASLRSRQLAVGVDVGSDQRCNAESAHSTSTPSVFFSGSGTLEFGSSIRFRYLSSDIERKRPTSGGLWASPFLSPQDNRIPCCNSCVRPTLTAPSFVSADTGTLRRPPIRSMRLLAWDQQNSTANHQDNKSSADQSSPKHIFLVVPAFHVAYQKTFKPLTSREKFDQWLQGTYDPRGLGLYAFEAATLAYSSQDGFCGYGKEEVDYLKCFAATEADANISSFFGDFLFPVIMHQDPRYFRLGEGSFGKRVGYAVSRVFFTHADSGRTVFFASALSGTVIGAAASNLYYPVRDRGFRNSLSRMGLDLGNTALFNVAAEFWPDIRQRLSHAFGRQ